MSLALGFLVVRGGDERFGLPLEAVLEVVDVAGYRPVPARVGALRGVMQLREHHLSLVNLSALLGGGEPPETASDTAVVVELSGGRVALEVDDVEEVAESGTPVGAAPASWARGVWRVGPSLVTVVEPAALAERLWESEAPR
jgi:chemotaxis signal transduction protein